MFQLGSSVQGLVHGAGGAPLQRMRRSQTLGVHDHSWGVTWVVREAWATCTAPACRHFGGTVHQWGRSSVRGSHQGVLYKYRLLVMLAMFAC